MDWAKLFTMQKKLDQHIVENHQLENKNLLEEKYLALLVELGELANETRCFKFWSTQAANDREKILEEYVDGIHFILSLGIEKGYKFTPKATKNKAEKTNSLTEQFNNVFQAILNIRHRSSQEKYNNLFNQFLQLGQMLSFSSLDIYEAYLEKNEVNFERQADGY